MIDYSKELVSALNKVLPTYYELTLTKDISVPCISYQERNNYTYTSGNTLGYSRVSYTIKVWANEVEDIQTYSLAVDDVLRPLGFTRTNCGELHDRQSSMIQKIMTYEALGLENY